MSTAIELDNNELEDSAKDFEVEFFGSKECRWYQIAARNAFEIALEQGKKRICVVQPTGAGKTLTSGLIFSSPRIRSLLGVPDGENLRILFVAHKHRLLSQAEREYAEAEGIELITQSMFSDVPADVVKRGWHVVCLDEAHHEACQMFQYQLEKLGDWVVLGLTATPDRADGCLIKFDVIIEPLTREQAVAEGYLAPTYLYSFVDAPERNKTGIVRDILDSYAELMGKTMVFMRTKAEARIVGKHIESLGYTVEVLLDQTEKQLNESLERFGAGDVQFIVNCNKINEGVDVKGCESVLLGRTYGSYPQLNQVIGRAARPDTPCRVFEIINPLSGTNLDTTAIVGTPEEHHLIYRANKAWHELEFDYSDPTCSKNVLANDALFG